MADNTNIPAPPSGTIVDSVPASLSSPDNQSQIPPPPSGTIVDSMPQQVTQQAPTSAPVTTTISAIKPPAHIGEALEQWTNNVMNDIDIKYGTDTTGVGSVLKKMGAHGVYAGNPEAVGDFMASLPLGVLKSIRGGGKVTQSGKRWEGAKDVVGGALQAATIPSAFVAPEAGEVAAKGLGTAAETVGEATSAVKGAAGRAVSGVTRPFMESAAQPELQAGIRQTASKVAQEAEVSALKTPSMYKTVEEVGNNVYSKSKSQYAQ